MSNQTEDDKGFFEKLGEILNAPLPGTVASGEPPVPDKTEEQGPDQSVAEGEDGSILERIKEILSTPVPGTASPGQAPENPLPEEGKEIPPESEAEKVEVLENQWWERDWEAFRQHQEHERQGFNMKQRRDQESFARYQEQEKQHFDTHQTHEFDVFKQHAQWKMKVWGQQIEAMKAGQQAPPQPWGIVPPPPPPPGMPIPPWLRKQGK